MMNNEQLVSSYKNNVIAKKGRIFLLNLFNYFITFIGAFFLTIIVANPIATNLPVTNDIKTEINTLSDETYKIVGDTHIQYYDATIKGLVSIDTMEKTYLTNLCKTSLFVYGEKYYDQDVKEEETFYNINLGEYPNDNLSYYYYRIKTSPGYEEISSYVFDGVDYSSDKDTFLYKKIMQYDNDTFIGYFISDEAYNALNPSLKAIPKWQILTKDYAKYLENYIRYSTSDGVEEKTYSNLGAAYLNASNYARNEVETKYTPYVERSNKINTCVQNFTVVYILSNTFAFTLAFAIFYILIPLVNKRGKYETLGHKVLKLGFSTREELEPTFKNYGINLISRYVIGYSCIFLSFIFTGIYQLSGVTFGYFSFFGLLMGCLVYGLFSNIFLMFSKHHQDFASFTSLLLIKDKNEFEGPIEENYEEKDSGSAKSK